ncbi:MAG TPA: type I restriction-modification enzyme R subunit C-terminal domain-containing protein [Thermoanaerobaculia bacterium]|nr:type I restriction-modification enzyme R subunit C-terminal domain-containing protein [Thermoanaerobaculia bacterium]
MSPADESEWKTRKARIDPRLDALGWKRSPSSALRAHRTEEHPTEHGPADYVLHLNDSPVAVVEAKKLTIGPQNVLTQAQRYARGLTAPGARFGDYRVPFLYSTNGEVTWFHDVRHPLNLSRQVANFHTPAALHEAMGRDFEGQNRDLRDLDFWHPKLRPYQRDANHAIENAIASRKRRMLVAMATGTGKTLTLVHEIYRLMKAGVARRVLFLVDRRALAAQAARAFASFDPEPGLKFNQIYEVYTQRFQRDDLDEDDVFDPNVMPNDYLTNPKPEQTFVFICTIQRLAINLFGREGMLKRGEGDAEEDAMHLPIPIHAFDFVVADECHRGYTGQEVSVWRNTLEHFDAIKVGLTATPASHTTAYFSEIVYRYEYERAVREGHLVDYDVITLRSNVRMNGLFLSEGEEVGVVDTTSGLERRDLLEDERQYDSGQLEQTITSPDSNRKILEELKRFTLEHEEQYGRFPKTLIFAVNDLPHTSHSDQLVRTLREVFGRGESFVQKITGRSVDRPLQLIRKFRNRPEPKIVVSVDLMSTGVDIPDLEFIVFLRPVKSRILFEQMLGRGTRKSESLPDKSHFTVVDCFDGTLITYFAKATSITAEAPAPPGRTIVAIIEDIWNNRDRAFNVRCLTKRLHRIDKEMSGEARDQFAAFVDGGDLAIYARTLARRLEEDFTSTMALLRNPAFQDLLLHYPRPQRTFIIAYEAQDEVSGERLLRDADGKAIKPEDYLLLFGAFVAENQSEIDAIAVLLDRPRDWRPMVLNELRQRLAATPERFTEDRLRIAHAATYHKSLVDIISMVKHAAKEEEPLLTSPERVERAFVRLTGGRSFTEAQQLWLDRIREHLVQNLSIDRDDFESIPVLHRLGGWGAANRAFDGQLEPLLVQINEAIAA